MNTVNDQPAGREPHDYSRDPLGVNDAFADGGDSDPIGTWPSDDGPGYDRHGGHDRRTLSQRLADAAAEMTGPAVSVEHVDPRELAGMPLGEAELLSRVSNAIYEVERGNILRRFAAWQVIALVREHDRAASHEGATVSALVDERFGPVGGER